MSKRNGKYIECKVCSNIFYAKLSQVERGKAKSCSVKCASVMRTGKTPWNKGIKGKNGRSRVLWQPKSCINCQKEFYSWRSDNQIYCSESCRSTFVFKRDGGNMKGKKLSEETKMKLRHSTINRILANSEIKGPTSIEKKLYDELKRRGLLFETQKLINGRFLVDAYIPSLNLVIEDDGDYWHSLDRVVKKDRAENAYLIKCGYKLLRLPEHEINDGSFINKIN